MNLCYRSISLSGPRDQNQDCVLEPLKSGADWWCAIADGVGGAEFGEVASRMCIEAVKTFAADGETMHMLFNKAAGMLYSAATNEQGSMQMSSTLSVLRISGTQAYVGHVGDTRIDHYRGDGVMNRTYDQTEVQKLLDDGILTKHQARRYPRRNVILSAMSPKKYFTLFENEFSIESGDRILLTSDGFHENLRRREIARISNVNSGFALFFDAINSELAKITLSDDATVLALEIQ